jgi:hypothetical protein
MCLKDLIILRGRNLYPQDVELTAERSHRDLRMGGGAAFSVDVESREALVVVHEVERTRKAAWEEIAGAVRGWNQEQAVSLSLSSFPWRGDPRVPSDVVVAYEGETARRELAAAREGNGRLDGVPNLLYLQAGEVRQNRVHVEDVEALPCPDFSGLPLTSYLTPWPVLPIYMGKGCYFNQCKFCDIPVHQPCCEEGLPRPLHRSGDH